jgi:hypothetical protein
MDDIIINSMSFDLFMKMNLVKKYYYNHFITRFINCNF